jgi:two-component system, OmpR family, phosphate regulon response regulator OmpR
MVEKGEQLSAHHILVIDDDTRIRELLRDFLATQNYRVSLAANAAEARAFLQGMTIDLAILDVMMPGETGLSLLADLRARGMDFPVLMLSALGDTDDRITGLSAGSDDYIAKPFDPRELLLRIASLLRRSAKTDAPELVQFGAFEFNLERGELRQGSEIIRLTTRERDLLRMLAANGGEPLSRQDLAGDIAGETARAVDVQINRLRQKIEMDPANPIYLQTVRGEGYALLVDRVLA